MMKLNVNTEEIFSLQNPVDCISALDYERAEVIIEAAKALNRSTYQCVYIIDYFKKGFLYVSKNMERLLCVDSEMIKISDNRFYFDYMPQEDLKLLLEIYKAGFKFIDMLPLEDRKDYTISCDFHILSGFRGRLIHHKLTPLILTGDGLIWLALCSISLATGERPGNAVIKNEKAGKTYQYSIPEHKWHRFNEIVLTENERAVLSLSTKGYTMNDIAELICRSVDTVKACKRNMFHKMGVKSITEALTYAQNHRLF